METDQRCHGTGIREENFVCELHFQPTNAFIRPFAHADLGEESILFHQNRIRCCLFSPVRGFIHCQDSDRLGQGAHILQWFAKQGVITDANIAQVIGQGITDETGVD